MSATTRDKGFFVSGLMPRLRAYTLKTLMSAADHLTAAVTHSHPPPPLRGIVRNVAYGPHRQQRLDVIPPSTDPPWPALIFVHGGGWVAGHKAIYTAPCRRLAGEGFCVFNLNYRLAPFTPWPGQLEDVAAAIGWVQRHATDYGAAPAALALAGDSAGAHLVSLYSATLHRPGLREKLGLDATVPASPVRALALFYGAYDIAALAHVDYPFAQTMFHMLVGSGAGAADRAVAASPIYHLGPDIPPCFITVAERDGLYPQSVRFAGKLAECGVPHRTLFFDKNDYPSANHGFLYLHWRTPARLAIRAAADFINQHMA